jgi:hypothetical protein
VDIAPLRVPCASIVDIDIVNDESELDKLLEARGANAETRAHVSRLRLAVETAVRATPADERLAKMLVELRRGLESAESSERSAADRATALARACDRVQDRKSAWQDLKERGVDALPAASRSEFAELSEHCAEAGLFIVPVGELEGWLRTQVPLSEGNKRDWVVRALQTLPNLNVRLDQPPWSFIALVHAFLESK